MTGQNFGAAHGLGRQVQESAAARSIAAPSTLRSNHSQPDNAGLHTVTARLKYSKAHPVRVAIAMIQKNHTPLSLYGTRQRVRKAGTCWHQNAPGKSAIMLAKLCLAERCPNRVVTLALAD